MRLYELINTIDKETFITVISDSNKESLELVWGELDDYVLEKVSPFAMYKVGLVSVDDNGLLIRIVGGEWIE